MMRERMPEQDNRKLIIKRPGVHWVSFYLWGTVSLVLFGLVIESNINYFSRMI